MQSKIDSISSTRPLAYLRSPYLWAFLAGAVTLTLMRPFLRFEPDPPPVLWRLPAYSLTAAGGPSFGSADLAGKIYVTSFLFTRCAAICPQLTRSMAELQQRYDQAGLEQIQLISISVDPLHDTPEVLRQYAVEHGLDPRRWKLLTGDPARIRELVEKGFKAPIGDAQTTDGGLVDIAHSGKFILVDGTGAVRGFYDSDPAGMDELFHRSRQLLHSSS